MAARSAFAGITAVFLIAMPPVVRAVDACTVETHSKQPPHPWFNYTILPPPEDNKLDPSLPADYAQRMVLKLNEFTEDMFASYPPSSVQDNMHGIGKAYAALRLFKNTGDALYLKFAKDYVDACLVHTGPPSYQTVGILYWPMTYTVAAMVYDLANEQPDKVQAWIAEVETALGRVDNTTDPTYLVGTAGLLYAATVLDSYFGTATIGRASVVSAATVLYDQGVQHAMANGSTPYLQWYAGAKNVGFLGQASGWGGPLYALLQVPELLENPGISTRLKQTVDFFVSMLDEKGNFWSAYPNRVQWCHGSPGVIQVFAQAYEVFSEPSYLAAAELAAEYTVSHGIIEKGLQLVHGSSGNSYLVLDLYRRTADPRWLYYVYEMQKVILDTPQLVDLNGQAIAYDCVVGSAIASTYSAIPLWSDLLTNQDAPKLSSCPFIGIHTW